MQKTLNMIRGIVRVEVECPYPERFVNVCAQNDVEFWGLVRVSETAVAVNMHIGGYRRLQRLAAGAGFLVRPVARRGVPFFLKKMRKRYALIFGMLAALILIWGASLFVWELRVVGNDAVSSAEILNVLEGVGVGVGSFGPGILSEEIANEVLMQIPQLSWIAVNVSGSRANVLVREKIPRPEIIDEKQPTMVYAVKSGIVSEMTVLNGSSMVKVGDTVLQGEVLMSGIMGSISSGERTVHAMGEVYARTWYRLSLQMPLNMQQKVYTGKTSRKKSIIIAGNKINFFFNSRISYDNYDKIVSESQLSLPTGNVLPFAFSTAEYAEYTVQTVRIDEAVAQELLQARLLEALAEKLDDGVAVETEFEAVSENGVITVTLNAECLEQIAAVRTLTESEMNSVNSAEDTDTEENDT